MYYGNRRINKSVLLKKTDTFEIKVLPRLELGSPDSESGVLTITP